MINFGKTAGGHIFDVFIQDLGEPVLMMHVKNLGLGEWVQCVKDKKDFVLSFISDMKTKNRTKSSGLRV